MDQTRRTKKTGKYDDIINLPHHVSDHHPRMPISDRAAQFAPFAALTGHSETIKETEKRHMEREEETRGGKK